MVKPATENLRRFFMRWRLTAFYSTKRVRQIPDFPSYFAQDRFAKRAERGFVATHDSAPVDPADKNHSAAE
jgi:hypothetical protein